jgi:hypothetical protein
LNITIEDVVIVALVAIVVFLVWERFHYRHRVSGIYDTLIDATSGLDPSFELRSHSELRRLYSLDAIIDDIQAKLELLVRHDESDT